MILDSKQFSHLRGGILIGDARFLFHADAEHTAAVVEARDLRVALRSSDVLLHFAKINWWFESHLGD